MQIKEIIEKKRDGGENTPKELSFLLKGSLSGEVQESQLSAWLMAVFFRGLSSKELKVWTGLMWHSGATFPRKDKTSTWVDKHSVGGVGDKPSLILVPLVTAVCEKLFGKGKVKIPMVSGRGLGITGGTLDKLESVPGFSPKISIDRAMELLEANGYFMAGQTDEIAPADRQIYSLRDVTGTVGSIPLIVSSIMSKKLAENLDGLVIDLKTGDGSLMREVKRAKELGNALIGVAKQEKISAVGILTRMEEPLGFKVGNHLEVEECRDFLSGKVRERGLLEVVLELATWMVFFGGKKKLSWEKCKAACEQALDDTQKLSGIFRTMFEVQGGDWAAFDRESVKLRSDWKQLDWKSSKSGMVEAIPAKAIGNLLNELGGGRNRKHDVIDPKVGFEFFKKVGDPIKKGEALVRVYYRHESDAEKVETVMRKIVRVAPKVKKPKWVLGILQ